MKRLLPPATVLLVLSAFAAAAEDKAPTPKGDLGKFQGTWTAKAGPEKNVPITVTIKGDAVTLQITSPNGQDFTSEGRVKIDENAKPHKTIDWVKFQGVNGEELPENLGLYEFVDADTLRVCSGGPGKERPTEFKAGDGGPPNVLVLNRKADSK